MPSTDSPLSIRYWLGGADPRPLAVFRIGFGYTLLHDMLTYASDLRAFLTDEGMLPRGLQQEPLAWSLFERVGGRGAVSVVFAAGCLALLAFTFGYRTRLATALSWLFLTCVHSRNLYVTDGGDDLARILMFGLLFTDAGLAWSLDIRLGRKRRGPAPALGLRFLQWHIALLYFVAARLKFRQGWLRRDVIHATLQLDGFVRPLGKVLLQWPPLTWLLGVCVVGLEWLFAFVALSPVRVRLCRALAIAAGLLVQGGIFATLKVGVFTETLLWAMALFLQPEWLDAAERWLVQRGVLAPEATLPGQPAGSEGGVPRLRAAAFALLSVIFLSQAWGPFIGSRIPEPAAFGFPRRALWLQQPMGLFDVVYSVPTWSSPGHLVDGTPVDDVLAVGAPGTQRGVGLHFSRWYKFMFKERERPFHWSALGAWLCRAYGERTGKALESFTLVETLTPPEEKGVIPRPPVRRERATLSCPSASRSAP